MTAYNLTANGSTAAYTADGNLVFIEVTGSFGGGTLTLQADFFGNGVVDAVELTAADVYIAEVPSGSQVQSTLAGATSPSLNITMQSSSIETLIKAKTDLLGTGGVVTSPTRITQSTTITVYTGEQVEVVLNTDDFTAIPIQVVIESSTKTDVQVITDGSITKTANTTAFTISNTATTEEQTLKYSVRKADASKEVLVLGSINVTYAAAEDA